MAIVIRGNFVSNCGTGYYVHSTANGLPIVLEDNTAQDCEVGYQLISSPELAAVRATGYIADSVTDFELAESLESLRQTPKGIWPKLLTGLKVLKEGTEMAAAVTAISIVLMGS